MKAELPKKNNSKAIQMNNSKKFNSRKNWNSQQGGKIVRRSGRG